MNDAVITPEMRRTIVRTTIHGARNALQVVYARASLSELKSQGTAVDLGAGGFTYKAAPKVDVKIPFSVTDQLADAARMEAQLGTQEISSEVFRFALDEVVRHVKSGGLYQICSLPWDNFLEADGTVAYGYRRYESNQAVGVVYYRAMQLMEDGRFTRV